MPIGNRRYSTARPSRNGTARSVWSAAYPAALVVADEPVMRAPCELGQRKAAGYAALQTLRDIAARERSRAGKCGVNSLERLDKKSSRNESIHRDTDRLEICATTFMGRRPFGALLAFAFRIFFVLLICAPHARAQTPLSDFEAANKLY